MSAEKELKHIPLLIAICYGINFLLGVTGGGFEMFSKEQALMWVFANLFFMSGSILFSIKLADEKHFISYCKKCFSQLQYLWIACPYCGEPAD